MEGIHPSDVNDIYSQQRFLELPLMEATLEAAKAFAERGEYEKAASSIQGAIEGISTPDGYRQALKSNDFKEALQLLFEHRIDLIEELRPFLSEYYDEGMSISFYNEGPFHERVVTTFDLCLMGTYPSPELSGVIFEVSKSEVRRRLDTLGFEEVIIELQTRSFDDTNDIFVEYLDLAKRYPERAEECILMAKEHIQKGSIPPTRSNCDELIDYYMDQIEAHPQQGGKWIQLAEERLANDVKHYYTYHFVAMDIADYYHKRSDHQNLERVVGLIYDNIERIKDFELKENLLTQLTLYHPELVRT